MKFYPMLQYWRNWFGGSGRLEKLRLLKQQRLILQQGLETTAEVIDSAVFDDIVGHLLPVSLWLKLKKADGSYCFIKSLTFLTLREIPVKGQQLRIKYTPDNPANIVII